MSVSYESAMATLTSMFGSVDREVVAMLLQANGGHMEKTVENLLAMTAGGGGEGEGEGAQGGGGGPATRQPAPMRRPSQHAQPQQQQAQPSFPPQWQQSPPQTYPPQQQQWHSAPSSHPAPSVPPPYAPSGGAYPPSQPSPYYPPAAQPNYPAYGCPPPLGVPYPQPHQPQQPYYGSPVPAPHSRPAGAALPANGPAPAGSVILLADDFLRPPSFFQSQLGPQWSARHPSAAATQIEQDALLAQMIQDEQFMQFVQQQQQQQPQPQPQAQPQPRPQPHQFPMQPQSAAAAAAAASASPRLVAPPAHPHPDFESRSRGNSAVWTPPAAAAPASASDSRAPAAAAAASASAAPMPVLHSPASSGAAGASGFGSEPLHHNLRAMQGSVSAPVSEQQSSFAKRWNSLTASAREKLARLSEKFKKDPLHDRDMDGGGDYQSMVEPDGRRGGAAPRAVELSDVRFAEEDDKFGAGSSSNADFLSAEEAANLQASYHAHVPARASASKARKNPFTVDDDADPFGAGANGSDVEDADDAAPGASSGSAVRFLQRGGVGGSSSSSSVREPSLPAVSRTLSGVRRGVAADDDSDDDDRGAYQPPRLAGHPSSGDDAQGPAWSAAAAPGSIFSPSQVNRGGGGGVTHPSRVDPPSDDEEEAARRSAAPAAAARKRSTAEAAAASRDKGRDKSMPLLQDM